MKPAEFFDLTPGEVGRWLGPAWRGKIETAYHNARLQRAKKLPAKSSELFKQETKPLSPEQFYEHTRDLVAEFNERVKNTPPVPAPKPKKKPRKR